MVLWLKILWNLRGLGKCRSKNLLSTLREYGGLNHLSFCFRYLLWSPFSIICCIGLYLKETLHPVFFQCIFIIRDSFKEDFFIWWNFWNAFRNCCWYLFYHWCWVVCILVNIRKTVVGFFYVTGRFCVLNHN